MKKTTHLNQLKTAGLVLIVLAAASLAQASFLNNKSVKTPGAVIPPMQGDFKQLVRDRKAIKTIGVLSDDFNHADKNKNHQIANSGKLVTTTPASTENRIANGSPTAGEVKTMLEQKFTSIYEDHFCCKEKNKVEFEWLAPVEIGGQRSLGSLPVPCWVAKIDVKVTFTKLSSGESKSVRRGINGSPVKEGFYIYRDAYDAWTYSTYAP